MSNMPFRSNGKNQKRAVLERKLCLAKETPEPVFDLSDCGLSEVPSGVFTMCRVFRKEVLLLQNNCLHSLSNGGLLKDLSHIKVLNLSNNKFQTLPEDISCLCSIEVLNLENNQIKNLPASVASLSSLCFLNLKGNKLKEFPTVLCNIPRLQNLNICDNKKIKTLPFDLCNLLYLEVLELDSENFTYPSPEICSKGVEAVKMFLCSESGREYIPSQKPSDITDSTGLLEAPDHVQWNDDNLTASYEAYQRAKEQRRQELLQMEERMKDTEQLHIHLTKDASERRMQLLKDIIEEQEKFDEEILQVQNKKERERQSLLAALSNIEEHSAKLIEQIMCLNEKNKNYDFILESLEQDRIESEELYSVKQEELENLRKTEILYSMKDMLQAERKQKEREAEKLEIVKKLQESSDEQDQKILDVLSGREIDQQVLINKLLEEEFFQKEAFRALQIQRDRRHREIAYQIKLIENELSKLTLAELKKHDIKAIYEITILAEHRTQLAELLTNLLEAKEQREVELKKRLEEMEEKNLNEIKDFWLIQFQKLLDKEPQLLIDAERALDPTVKSILINSGASAFIPLFAAKNIGISQLSEMSMGDLKKVGVLNETICEAILAETKQYLFYPELWKKTLPKEDRNLPNTLPGIRNLPSPSAPPENLLSPDIQPSAPLLSPGSEMKLWRQIECIVCMDAESSAVFLPCGHVCCCWNCSSGLTLCPMCRTVVQSKFTLTVASLD